MMRIGCDLPYFADAGEIRAFAQAAEDLGYDHLGFSEHVASTEHSPFPPRFSFTDPWHESFTMLGFLSAVTTRIELVTSMMLLSLRPAALAAKQAAEVSLLSGGRLRLGVAVGWDTAEVRALGFDPVTRAARMEEQIEAMRLLWTQESVTYAGRFVQLEGVGLHPRPAQPIPVWMGAGNFASGGRPTDRSLRRIARLADGYKMFAPLGEQPEVGLELMAIIARYAVEAGRNPAAIAIEARLITHVAGPDEWAATAQFWADHGATHLGLGNRVARGGVDAQIALIANVMDVLRHHRSPQANGVSRSSGGPA